MPKPEILNRASADKLALFDRLKSGKPGDIVTWEELEKIVGRPVKSGTHGYSPLLRARKKCIRELGIVWAPLSGHGGLKCLDNAEIVAAGAHDMQCHRRRARQSNVKLGCADIAKLTNPERVKLAGMMAVNSVIESAANDKSLKRIEGAMDGSAKPLPVARTLEILKA